MSNTDFDVVHYAHGFARLGYSVYPVNVEYIDGRKVPSFQLHNLEGEYIGGWKRGDYPTEREDIARYWEGYSGIAVNTGRSGLVVVDIDVKHGDGFADLESFLDDNQLILPATPLVVKSPSGGEHRYYRAGSIEVGNSVKSLGENVDIRGVGGCLFAPPTEGYELALDGPVPHVSKLPVFPDAIAERLTRRPTRRSGVTASPQSLTSADREFHTKRRADALNEVEKLQDGNRHQPMVRLASIIFGATAVLGEDLDEYAELFMTAYELSGGTDIRDAQQVIRDVIKHVRDNPWESTFAEVTGDLPEFIPETLRASYMDLVQRKELDRAATEAVKERERERTYANTILVGPTPGNELLAEKPEEDLWLVEGLLHWEKCRAKVIGQYKSGKSTLVLNLLHALTNGGLFLDRFTVRKPVKVAYMDLELGKSLAYSWLSKMPGLNRDNFDYYDMVGRGSQLDMRSDHLRKKWAQQLSDTGVELLIIDPMSPVYSALGVDEHGPEVRRVLDSLDELVAMTGMHGVVVTDHAGHKEEDRHRARGHSSKMDWLTTRLVVTRGTSFDSDRMFFTDGRGTDPAKGGLVLNEDTNMLTLKPTEAAVRNAWLAAQTGPLTIQEAVKGLGVSEKPARQKLRDAGWKNVARNGEPSRWVKTATDITEPDPFM